MGTVYRLRQHRVSVNPRENGANEEGAQVSRQLWLCGEPVFCGTVSGVKKGVHVIETHESIREHILCVRMRFKFIGFF